MKQTTNNGKMIAALLIGAAVGGALGLIFAPDKGSETRKKIIAGGEDLTNSIKDKFDDLLCEVKKEVEQMKEKAGILVENGLDKIEKFEIK